MLETASANQVAEQLDMHLWEGSWWLRVESTRFTHDFINARFRDGRSVYGDLGGSFGDLGGPFGDFGGSSGDLWGSWWILW